MTSFREQMQELAAKIARSRNERQQAVAEFPKFHEQLRRQVRRDRDDVRRELDSTARDQARQLKSFTAQNQRNISRLLRETHASRVNRSQAARSRLQRELSKNRQDLLRSLQHNHAQRKRMQRSVSRQSLQAIQAVQSRVHALRTGTQRMIRSLSGDRMEGRRIWANVRSMSRPARFDTSRTDLNRSEVKPADLVRRTTNPTLAIGELTGLAMPPTRA